MNVAELIALLETIEDQGLEVAVGFGHCYIDFPADPVVNIEGNTAYIEEGE